MPEQPHSELQSEKQTSDEESQSSPSSLANNVKPTSGPGLGWKFWVLFVTLCISGFAVTMEGSIVVVNCYTLASAIFQPLVGWLAEAFGRKPLMLGSVVVFAVGSAMAGAANSLGLILAGRLIQGIGGGAIPLMAELIISDQLPLEQRPQMLGMVMATSCLGLVFGPIIGGAIVDHSTWRWIFFSISLWPAPPFAAISLRVTAKRFDWVGNMLLPASSVAILLPLTMGGKMYPWNSAQVIAPLVLGFCGLVGFGVYEHFCPYPLIPLRLLRNPSAVSLQIQSFIHSMLIMWINYFLTIYFQAVLGVSPQQVGFDLMPTIVAMVVFSIVGGVAMSKLPRSWAVLNNLLAFAMMSIGLGCFTIITASSLTVVHVVLQIIVAGGNGLLLATLLPNVQGQFNPEDMTAVTALFNFLRSFALVWGMTIPSIIFDQSVNSNAGRVPQELRPLLEGGGAYIRASNEFMQSFHGTTKEQILGLYELALRDTWWGAMAFALLGFLLVALQRPGKPSTSSIEDTQQSEGEKERASS
ncbi:Major facilitator superfamily domain general substrate transporter [Penicillium fimorum]|uniref:Major facilitator superfamily domain general substrate transporter n=1 Tax=Penicillium fimorum TaxID=1882269 RepID=A0A9X0C9P0_9EURO|nr:Major facilitator superfamily domain general substrate transporter [Penicillium fimorum]